MSRPPAPPPTPAARPGQTQRANRATSPVPRGNERESFPPARCASGSTPRVRRREIFARPRVVRRRGRRAHRSAAATSAARKPAGPAPTITTTLCSNRQSSELANCSPLFTLEMHLCSWRRPFLRYQSRPGLRQRPVHAATEHSVDYPESGCGVRLLIGERISNWTTSAFRIADEGLSSRVLSGPFSFR